ncbi:ATP-dependent endonuclease [Neobacillus niacini]|uniref:ATP-dependent nuclease n=1 Tax=Neobacillus niacini TaxID=86668 RepID=UPI0021CB3E6A|nr:AAA family ATPase [Neobacillus niacini]MCM3768387.1 AAA family ATPase [Neobacillus niacini]
MNIPKTPYISRVQIQNFRNFKFVNVDLTHKQVIIGENNVGKTNFLSAIQLILDPKLSDEDRFLNDTDFYEGIESPMENGEEIKISIDIKGFDHNKMLLATLSDATLKEDPATLRLTYHYYASQNDDGTYEYQYRIFQGTKEDVPFNHNHRRYLNLKVIPAIRDVETEMKNMRTSPVNKLIKNYDIRKEELKDIADRLKETSDEVLSIDELVHLTNSINSRFSTIIGQQVDSSVSLETIDLDPNRILNTLKLMIGQGKRPINETSLGLNNILYISLILLSLEDKTIPPILKEDTYLKLLDEADSEILKQCYRKNDNGNYLLKDMLSHERQANLYTFMDMYVGDNKGFTILAIEEPEAHLHPALQRLIFKDVMKQNTSVLMTTHSPHITSVAPINSIVHLRAMSNGTIVKTTASLQLSERDCKDLERYVDVKKGEIYFGKGVILVEGVAEEYLIPSFAEALHMPLDKKGIICCTINSTNFKPYVQFLDALGIPYVVITDGDYYFRENAALKKTFGQMHDKQHKYTGYDGLDRTKKILIELGKIDESDIPNDINEEDTFYKQFDFFIGIHTMEIDMMDISNDKGATAIFSQVFNDLTSGGATQKKNFKDSLNNGNYVDCLKKIESKHSHIGKGRFAQGLSSECTKDNIPPYIEEAIQSIFLKVDDL